MILSFELNILDELKVVNFITFLIMQPVLFVFLTRGRPRLFINLAIVHYSSTILCF